MKTEVGNKYGMLTVVAFSHVNKHRKAQWKCVCECGKAVVVGGNTLRGGHTQSCGCLRKETSAAMCRSRVGKKNPLWGKIRESHPNWRGGRIIDNDGYIKVKNHEHPRSDHGGYVPEHILVAEQALGEYIPKGQVIHHINGDKTDNRLENLWWFASQSEHMAHHHVKKGNR